jgi:hypothetical protein
MCDRFTRCTILLRDAVRTRDHFLDGRNEEIEIVEHRLRVLELRRRLRHARALGAKHFQAC